MRKLILIIGLFTLLGCGDQEQFRIDKNVKTWVVQIRFTDNTIDTISFRSECYPEMNIRNGVSILNTCWGPPQASYVKSFKVISSK